MPDFFENFKDGEAKVRLVKREFLELKNSDEVIDVDEDNFDLVLQHGSLYMLDKDENVVNEDLKEILAEEHNEASRKYVTEYNEEVDKYNEEHKNDVDFEKNEHKTFEPVSSEDMIYELDSSYIALTEDGALNYIPFNYIFHKENRHAHESIGPMLYEYVVDDGFNLEDAIEIVLL